jgi:hypothetical protein
VPWAATLLARSQFLEGAGGPYFGSARDYASSLTFSNKTYHKRTFEYYYLSLKNSSFSSLQWILLIFAFWAHQMTGLEASERNKDASHAPVARKLTPDAPHTIRVAAFLAHAFPNQVFLTKRREKERGERKEKEGRGERGEREKRRQQTSPLNGPSVARAKRALLFG